MRRRRSKGASKLPRRLRTYRPGDWQSVEAWHEARRAYWEVHPDAFRHPLDLFAGYFNASARRDGRPVPLPEHDDR